MIASVEISLSPFLNGSHDFAANWSELLVDWFHEFAGRIGLPCTCFERDTHHVVARSQADSMPFTPAILGERASQVRSFEIHQVGEDLLYFLAPVPVDDNFVLGGFARTSRTGCPMELVMASLEADWCEAQFNQWLTTVPVCDQQVLERLLNCSLQSAEQHRHESSLQLEVNTLSEQIEYTYEQINLLHTLTRNLHLSCPTEDLAGNCIEKLQSLIDCACSVIALHDSERSLRFISHGQVPFDQAGLGRLLARFQQYDWSHPLVRNKLQDSLLGSDFPGLKNLVIAPIGDGPGRHGWIVTCNLRGGRDFSNVEATLLGSIATILGTHARNIQLFDEHDELLPSFVRSLVSSLDAKDPHTRGHSERVALIARRLGKQLRLPESDLDDIYLSSLLHDLGKIGVDDRILSKPGRLTVEEFAQIQQHPLIGYQILSPLKNLKSILPGVRNHHEAYNGKGYPDKLSGENIPLMARIISVADSYDAMASDRPYRMGMPREKLEDIFHRGSGSQWDPRVIEAYFVVREDVRQLCESYSLTVGNMLDNRSLNQSGIFSTRNLGR